MPCSETISWRQLGGPGLLGQSKKQASKEGRLFPPPILKHAAACALALRIISSRVPSPGICRAFSSEQDANGRERPARGSSVLCPFPVLGALGEPRSLPITPHPSSSFGPCWCRGVKRDVAGHACLRAGMLQAEQGPLNTGDDMVMAAARSHV